MFRWISIFLLLVAAPAASAQQTPNYDKPQGYVSDFAHVVDVAGSMEIERYLGGLERGTGVQIAVVTVPTLNGEPIEDFTNTLFRKWGIGQKGSNEGLMVLFAIQDRKMRIEVGYGLEAILPDGAVGTIQRSLREELRAGRYGDAILKCVQGLGTRIEQGKGVAVSTDNTPQRRTGSARYPGPPQVEIPFWAILLGIFLIFFVLPRLFGGGRSGRHYRGYGGGPYWGGGGWGGGGFGGSSGGGDSGGGFGGFGGGDSGGGGASSDW